jgi:thiamine-monophosphate kinase
VRIHEVGEFGLIDRLAARLRHAPNGGNTGVVVGIGDDTAVLRYQPDHDIVATTDALVEGVHFREDTITYHNLGFKAMAASISDIAAMGGVPLHGLISIAIPSRMQVETLEEVYDGVAEMCNLFGCTVVGGDIVKTDGPLLINIALLGAVQRTKALLRSTAQVGDVVFVTGPLGGSAAGLALQCEHTDLVLEQSVREDLLRFHERPIPQVLAGQLLVQSDACTSCNDISDGLANELHEIASASGVSIRIQEEQIPIHPSVLQFSHRIGHNPYEWALYGGEDYQLVGTVRKHQLEIVQTLFREKSLPFYVIGEVTNPGSDVSIVSGRSTVPLEKRGYHHFR